MAAQCTVLFGKHTSHGWLAGAGRCITSLLPARHGRTHIILHSSIDFARLRPPSPSLPLLPGLVLRWFVVGGSMFPACPRSVTFAPPARRERRRGLFRGFWALDECRSLLHVPPLFLTWRQAAIRSGRLTGASGEREEPSRPAPSATLT